MSKIDGAGLAGECPLSGRDGFVGASSYVNRIPESWVGVSIGSVSSVIGGGTPPSKEESCFAPPGEGIPWITPADLSGYKKTVIRNGKRDLTEKGLRSCSAKKMPKGSVLFSSRAPVGYVAIAGADLTTNQGFKSFVFPDGVDSRFAYYQLRYLKPVAEAMATGTTFKELSGAAAAKLPFALAPLNEQRRIADKLDRVLARVDAANEHLSRVGSLLKQFRRDVLAYAFTGKLTESFRNARRLTPPEDAVSALEEIPRPNRYKTRTDAVIAGDYALSVNDAGMDAPSGWLWVPMVDIARMESGHTPSKSVSAYWGGDIPWIGIADARTNHASTIDDTIQKTSKLGLANSAARLLPAGTVCVSRTASVGYVVKMGRPMATSQDFVNWVCTDVIDPDWLKWLFVAEGQALLRFGKGSTHTTVYFPEWLSLHVALPSIEEQREIVARVVCLLEYADGLEDRLLSMKAKCRDFVPALLSKAFRGELVSQDPNDEHASDLLARLAEAKATESQNPTRRKRQASA